MQYDPIHKEAPVFTDQSTEQEVLSTGIKVIDLIEPYPKGGKIGLFGGAGVGKTVVIMELINNIAKVRGANSNPRWGGRRRNEDGLRLKGKWALQTVLPRSAQGGRGPGPFVPQPSLTQRRVACYRCSISSR